ncbi:hypothetical protein L6164_006936 [Bauhinia variegata]|uniref:Uncharacterized protein n=1 Tax=Bauhinia variegata TaxID=167791 RepID=A0ACB9PXU0_BAUVA|nr:hypothetical protein L6164_006936 [Bauhinia variegata]
MHSLRRALALVSSKEQLVLQPTTFILQSYSTTVTRKRSKSFQKSSSPSPESPKDAADAERPRPTEIPFQPKVANSINIIGHVRMPLQFQTSADGKSWAGTVIKREKSPTSPELWIPAIFEGDLAHIAACHLKENDCIHVAGQLYADPPFVDEKLGQSNVQILVQDLNFVQGYPEYNRSAVSEQEEISSSSESVTKVSGSLLDSWRDLLDNPKDWSDYRDKKLNKLVNPRYPDFKRKDGRVSLWLDNKAPKWVLSKLEGLEFDVHVAKPTQSKERKVDESWRELVENPNKWWDNRSNKRNQRAPDFKHKETGEALWLDNMPSWALSRLPPLKT